MNSGLASSLGNLSNASAQNAAHALNQMSAAQNQMGQASMAQPPPPMTAVQVVAARKAGLLSRAKVLEYIEAQMKMKLFGDDKDAERCFHTAMEIGSRELLK